MLFALPLFFCVTTANQVIMESVSNNVGWELEVANAWDVLGPFPIHAREQQFLSPSYPINLSLPIDFKKTWPSAYADHGRVGWSTIITTESNFIDLSFPHIRWKSLRETEGWAAVQHHAVLKKTITIYPIASNIRQDQPYLMVNLVGGSYFTVLPSNEVPVKFVPEWYAGNIYGMERALSRRISLPVPASREGPTTYDILVAGDYEIRLFGDPRDQNSDIPVQKIDLDIALEVAPSLPQFQHVSSQDVLCSFVDGFAFGDAIGIGLRSISGWWTIYSAVISSKTQSNDAISVKLAHDIRLAPGQTRIVPIRITQTEPFKGTNLFIELSFKTEDTKQKTTISLAMRHIPLWSADTFTPILGTYFYMNFMPTAFSAVPPRLTTVSEAHPPILALHGAGVDVIDSPWWAEVMPRRNQSWFVLPSGRTSWGLDWHGPSAQDAWSSVDALEKIVAGNALWHDWRLEPQTKVVVVGHSNGGQGAWYLASRYPDRVLGVVPAAAYIKSQAYVPLTLSRKRHYSILPNRSAHYIDPMLRAILESSLTPDDNDLFMSNLAHVPVLAIHGGNDNNVPVWHTRELVGVIQRWNADADISYIEVENAKHWYSGALDNPIVGAFLDRLVAKNSLAQSMPEHFTLTVSIPAESGPLHGWRIERLQIPGRLGRLSVETNNITFINVVTININCFSVDLTKVSVDHLRVDGMDVRLPSGISDTLRLFADEDKIWTIYPDSKEQISIQTSGRIQTMLSSSGPLVIVVPDDHHSREMSAALRLAHDLHIYHRLDTAIILSSEATTASEEILRQGNLVVIGNESALALQKRDGIWADHGSFSSQLNHHKILAPPVLEMPGLGILFMHSHPTLKDGKMLFLQSTSHTGLEKALRLFPIRTGVTVPDWIIVGPKADDIGASGVLGAGVWGDDWSWSQVMSWNV